MKDTHTPPRSVRVPDDVWDAAKAEADVRNEAVSEAIVRFLRLYGAGTDVTEGRVIPRRRRSQ